jgi:sugar O-acyltransferase (sialic acid O-acetyltransferase NeuD family)
MKNTIIYGTSNMSRILYEDIKAEKMINVVGFCADKKYIRGDTFCNLPLYDIDDVTKYYSPKEYDMMVVFSHRIMRDRRDAFDRAKFLNYNLPNYISPYARIMGQLMGENNIILGGVYLGAFGSMGNNNIIRYNTYIGHDFVIGSHNYISPGVNIGGGGRIGDLCFIGIGSTSRDKISIADETLIGAGSVLIKDTEKLSVHVGNPARRVKYIQDKGIIFE